MKRTRDLFLDIREAEFIADGRLTPKARAERDFLDHMAEDGKIKATKPKK